ncbi:hypothetical protein ZWY2020_037044 [Hordeum vulgare]|nr:hypothetical protein ZWY2020_037044 [Hordeum vulgare]
MRGTEKRSRKSSVRRRPICSSLLLDSSPASSTTLPASWRPTPPRSSSQTPATSHGRVALFSSKEKARLFPPYVEERKSCTVVASATGKLAGIDIEAVKKAVKDLSPP